MASATSRPPTPIASMPRLPAAQVCESEPARVEPGLPKCSMWVGCETPLPGPEYQSPNRRAAERRNRWSAMLRSSACSRLWSTYCTDTSVATRSRPMPSSSSITIVPVASCVSVWSIRSPISEPGVISPDSRCEAMSLRATFDPIGAGYPDSRRDTPGARRTGDRDPGVPDSGSCRSSLDALGREHLERAAANPAGRSAETVYGGHEHVLRQTILALRAGTELSEHGNPGEASVMVLRGRVRLVSGQDAWEAMSGDLLAIPPARHSLEALEDSVIVLTVAKLP